MSTHFEIRFDQSEGALLRCLGLIQRRGHCVTEMAMRSHPEGPVLTAAIETNGRSAETLMRQIQRLHDVRGVDQHGDATQQHSLADYMRAVSRFLPMLAGRPQAAAGVER